MQTLNSLNHITLVFIRIDLILANMLTTETNDFIKENNLFKKNHRILIAVSGGPDSVVTARILHELGYRIGIAHCHFGLRGSEADADEIFTASLAEQLSVPFYTQKFDTKKFADDNGLSIQMAARELRYTYFNKLLKKEGFNFTAVGTQLNDNMETVLLNLVRGTGLKGLTGIPVKRDFIVRPLLFASRERIEQYAHENDISYREDSTNYDNKYRRNAIRNEVIPELKKLNPSIEETFSENIGNLTQAESFITHQLDQLIPQLTSHKKNELLINFDRLLAMPDAEFILFRTLQHYGFHRKQTVKIADSARSSIPGKQFHSPGYTLTLDRSFASLKKKQQRKNITSQLAAGDNEISDPVPMRTYVIRADELEDISGKNTAYLDYDKLKFPLTVRSPKPGDRIKPLGMKGTKKLSDLFIDEKVPLQNKEHIPVVISGDDIVWAAGYRISEDYKVTSASKRVFVIEMSSGSDRENENK